MVCGQGASIPLSTTISDSTIPEETTLQSVGGTTLSLDGSSSANDVATSLVSELSTMQTELSHGDDSSSTTGNSLTMPITLETREERSAVDSAVRFLLKN